MTNFPSLASLSETLTESFGPQIDAPDVLAKSAQDKKRLTSSRRNTDQFVRSYASDSSLGRDKRSASIITNPYEGFERPPTDDQRFRSRTRVRSGRHSRYSPTSSIKRGKAERLLKEHGSPPGIRVTAGGRIVPDGLPQLSSPRFNGSGVLGKFGGSSAYPRLNPENYSNIAALHQLNHCIVEVGNGVLCQVVNGQLYPLGVQGAPFKVAAPNTNFQSADVMAHITAFNNQQAPFQSFVPATVPITPQSPFAPIENSFPLQTSGEAPNFKQLQALETVHASLETELKALDRNEVLNRAALSSANKADIVRKRIELTNRLDESRLNIKSAKQYLDSKSQGDEDPSKIAMNVNAKAFAANQRSSFQAFPVAPATPFYGHGQNHFPPLTETSNAQNPQYSDFVPAWPQYEPVFHSNVQVHPAQTGFHSFEANQFHTGASDILQHPENMGLGISNLVGEFSTTGEPGKQQPFVGGNMNLDGVANQPRRSHALPIKAPNEKANYSSLNPASPVYQPKAPITSVNEHGKQSIESNQFIPSADLIAHVDHLVRSPIQNDQNMNFSKTEHNNGNFVQDPQRQLVRELEEVGYGVRPEATEESGGFQTSDSSATTGDFFPHDALQHSTSKYSFNPRDNETDLSAWMRNSDNDLKSSSTPARAPNKFVFSDSPDDKASSGQTGNVNPIQVVNKGLVHSSGASTVTNSSKQKEDTVFDKQSPALDHKIGDNQGTAKSGIATPTKRRPANIITPQSINQGSRGAFAKHMPTPSESEAYLAGYAVGYRQELIGDNDDPDYRKGYRDGLIQASTHPSSGSHSAKIRAVSQPSPSVLHAELFKPGQNSFPMSSSRGSSFPSFVMPVVPDNSSTNSPSHLSLDEPLELSLRQLALKAPGSTTKQIVPRQSGIQASSQESEFEPNSPLTNQYSGNQMRHSTGALRPKKGDSFAVRMSNLANNLDQQRYPIKSKISIASSSRQARGWFPQFDGSAEDEEDQGSSSVINKSVTKSPSTVDHKEKARSKTAGPSSPIKKSSGASSPVKKASAAVAKLTGMNYKREKMDVLSDSELSVTSNSACDPAKMPSPDKANWRAKWNKRFEDIKKKEQKDPDECKDANPLPLPKRDA